MGNNSVVDIANLEHDPTLVAKKVTIVSSRLSELNETDFDTNSTSTATSSLDIRDNKHVTWGISATTGTHATHVIKLQQSLDNVTFSNTGSILTGVGIKDNLQITARYIRLKVTTAEGSASTVEVRIHAK